MASDPLEFIRGAVEKSPPEEKAGMEDLLKKFETACGGMLGQGGAKAKKPFGQAQGVEEKMQRAQVLFISFGPVRTIMIDLIRPWPPLLPREERITESIIRTFA